MMRHLSIAIGLAATLVLSSSSSFAAEEAKAMLEKAVAALKDDKAKALAMFNKGEGGFKDRDLYVFCANASDGVIFWRPCTARLRVSVIVFMALRPRGVESWNCDAASAGRVGPEQTRH